MNKEQFNTMMGSDAVIKDQYRELVTDILDWNLSIAKDTVKAVMLCNNLSEAIVECGIDNIQEYLNEYFITFGKALHKLLFDIINEHSKNVFPEGINIEQYMYSNATRIIGKQLDEEESND